MFTGDLNAALDLARQAHEQDPVGQRSYIAKPRTRPPRTQRPIRGSLQADLLWQEWRAAGSPIVSWISRVVSAAALAHGLLGDGHYERWRDRARTIAGPEPTPTPGTANRSKRSSPGSPSTPTKSVKPPRRSPPPSRPSTPRDETFARAPGAELAVVSHTPDAAERLSAAMPAAAENDWAAACLLRASGRLNRDLDTLAAAAEAWHCIDARFEQAATLALIPRP